MPGSHADLLTLIRLLEGQLPGPDGIAVRDRLTVDAQFRERYKLLTEATEHSTPLDDLDAISKIAADQVAAFLEGRMNPKDSTDFEDTCWQTPAILREIVSTFRSSSASKCELEAFHGVRERLAGIVAGECAQVAELRTPATKPTNGSTQNGKHRRRRHSKDIKPKPNGKRTVESVRASPITTPSTRAKLNRAAILVGILTVVLVATATWFWTTHQGAGNEEPLTENSAERKKDQQSVDDRLRISDWPDNNRSIEQKDDPNYRTPKNTPAVAVRPKQQPVETPGPQLPVPEIETTFASIDVSEVYGIVGQRKSDAGRWSGIRFSDESRPEYGAVTVRTLPAGWLHAKFSTGLEFVLAGDSEVRLSARQHSKKSSEGTLVTLDIRRGSFALKKLRRNDRIVIRSSRHESSRGWQLRATGDSSSVGFLRSQSSPGEIVVWNGGIEFGNKRIDAGRSIRWNGRGFGDPIKSTTRHAWRLRPQRRFTMRKSLIDEANRSRDLLAVLSTSSRKLSAKDQALASTLSFSLDPVTSVPAASASNSETRRLTALRWLITADKTHPNTDLVWKGVLKAAGPTADKLSLRSWFHPEHLKGLPQTTFLRELSVGLGPQQPIFVRQSAIFFLRRITRLPLNEYKPDRPTAAAISSVRQKTRRVVTSLRQRGRSKRRKP